MYKSSEYNVFDFSPFSTIMALLSFVTLYFEAISVLSFASITSTFILLFVLLYCLAKLTCVAESSYPTK